MKIFIIILVVWITFAAFVWSRPSEWVKWNEWQEHLKTHHHKE